MTPDELFYQRVRSVIETEKDTALAASIVCTTAARHYEPRPSGIVLTAEQLRALMVGTANGR